SRKTSAAKGGGSGSGAPAAGRAGGRAIPAAAAPAAVIQARRVRDMRLVRIPIFRPAAGRGPAERGLFALAPPLGLSPLAQVRCGRHETLVLAPLFDAPVLGVAALLGRGRSALFLLRHLSSLPSLLGFLRHVGFRGGANTGPGAAIPVSKRLPSGARW